METLTFSFWGKSRYWWAVLIVGILLLPCGIWFAFRPFTGYSIIASLLGWALVVLGVIQLIIAGDTERSRHGWGWWLAGGIFDLVIGVLLIGNIVLRESILPYVFAFLLLYRGVKYIVAGATQSHRYRGWWLYLLNGVLLLLLSLFFFFSPLTAAVVIVYLCAVTFIYWGLMLIVFAIDLKPTRRDIRRREEDMRREGEISIL